MYYMYFISSLFIFLAFLILAFLTRNKQVKSLLIVTIGTLIAAFLLVFPLYEQELFLNFFQSFIFVIELPTLSEDVLDFYDKLQTIFPLYRYLLYIYYILAPILTASVLFTFIRNKILLFRSASKTSKTVHIFSELNEKSFKLAKTIKTKDNIVIICNPNEKSVYNYEAKIKDIMLIQRKMNDINIKRYYGKIKFYAIEENEDINLNHTLQFINNYRNTTKNITCYLFSNSKIASILLDSIDKGNIETIIVNELEKIVYNVLDQKPLYLYANNKHISVLLVGCGDVGMQFLKTIIWCGQMIDYTLEIKVIDEKATEIENKLLFECRELNSNNYNLKFYETSVFVKEENLPLENVNYIIVALGDDAKNIEVAIKLRSYYSKNNTSPFIGLVTKNEEKQKLILNLKNEKEDAYNLYPFGSMKELYGTKSILNENIENLAKKVHLLYDKNDANFKNYNKLEYNKKSSRAVALHLKYKIYSVIEKIDIQEFASKLKDQKIVDLLAENEHNRWLSYERSNGYQKATIKDVLEYKSKVNNHIYHLAKLHPCLIPFKDLDKLSQELSKIFEKEFDFKSNDYDIVLNIVNILKEEKK